MQDTTNLKKRLLTKNPNSKILLMKSFNVNIKALETSPVSTAEYDPLDFTNRAVRTALQSNVSGTVIARCVTR
jgi:hypothetical protein